MFEAMVAFRIREGYYHQINNNELLDGDSKTRRELGRHWGLTTIAVKIVITALELFTIFNPLDPLMRARVQVLVVETLVQVEY